MRQEIPMCRNRLELSIRERKWSTRMC